MQSLQERYLELLLGSGALAFGEFKTKSGRLSPYFFNTGAFDTGSRLNSLGEIYAAGVTAEFGGDIANVYGPAYKGIPLALATAGALARAGRDVTFTFNRKEAKGHGEGGNLVGHQYQGGERVVVVEDVITGGTSLHETLPLLGKLGVRVLGVLVGVDRQERGRSDRRASVEIAETYGVPVRAIVTLDWVIGRLTGGAFAGRQWLDAAAIERIRAYRQAYGA